MNCPRSLMLFFAVLMAFSCMSSTANAQNLLAVTAAEANEYWFQLNVNRDANRVKVRCRIEDRIYRLNNTDSSNTWTVSKKCPVGSIIDVSVNLSENNQTFQGNMTHSKGAQLVIDLDHYVPPEDIIDRPPIDTFFNGTLNDFFLWPDPTTGNAVVVFKNGTMRKLEIIVPGYAGWSDLNGVLEELRSMKERGIVPYIHSYHFGDDGLWTHPIEDSEKYRLAVDWDTIMAKVVGNFTLAFVNIEPEWDDRTYMSYLNSPAGLKMFKDRISAFRTYSNKAVLLSTPGLWLPSSDYTFFAEIDALLDFRGNELHFVNSYNRTCSARSEHYNAYFEGTDIRNVTTYWGTGIMSYDDALQHGIKGLREDNNIMSDIWGYNKKPYISGDVGISSCGWGNEGAAQILNQFVQNMDCLYASGYRGMALRNTAPLLENRAMGNLNEGMMIWNGGEYHSEPMIQIVQAGLLKVVSLMENGPNCTAPIVFFSLIVHTGPSDKPAVFSVNLLLRGLEVKCGGTRHKFVVTQWNEKMWWLPSMSSEIPSCPHGSSIEVRAVFRDNTYVTGAMVYDADQTLTINLEESERIPLPYDSSVEPEESASPVSSPSPQPQRTPLPSIEPLESNEIVIQVGRDAGAGWMDLFVYPGVFAVTVKCAGVQTNLENTDWDASKWYSPNGLQRPCPSGSSVDIVLTLNNGKYLLGQLTYSVGHTVYLSMTDAVEDLPEESIAPLTVDMTQANSYYFHIILNKEATSFQLSCAGATSVLRKAAWDNLLWYSGGNDPTVPCPVGSPTVLDITLSDGATYSRTINFASQIFVLN